MTAVSFLRSGGLRRLSSRAARAAGPVWFCRAGPVSPPENCSWIFCQTESRISNLRDMLSQFCLLWFLQTSISLINWELPFFLRFPFGHLLSALLAALFASFRSRAALQLEILAPPS